MAVRDHPHRPPPVQCLVLDRLALRLDWNTGRGFASVEDLCADADTSKPTVKRATAWARKVELLACTRRGHRLGNGQKIASEWRLLLPSQGVTGEPLTISRAQQDSLKGSTGPSQGLTTDPPSKSSTSRSSPSPAGTAGFAPVDNPQSPPGTAGNGAERPPARARALTREQAFAELQAIDAGTTDDELDMVLAILTGNGAKSALAVLGSRLRSQDRREVTDLIRRARQRLGQPPATRPPCGRCGGCGWLPDERGFPSNVSCPQCRPLRKHLDEPPIAAQVRQALADRAGKPS